VPVVVAVASLRTPETLITADAGYHSEANLAQLAALQVPALIADNDMRRRDERFATQDRYLTLPNPLHDKSKPATVSSPAFTPADFTYDADARTCTCPAGESLYRKGQSNLTRDYVVEHFRGAKRDCVPCALRAQCLRTPDTTAVRNVAFVHGGVEQDTRRPRETHTMRMKVRIDSDVGRAQYKTRFATVEPVLPICGTTSGSIASRCAVAPKFMDNGNSTASYTTSRSWRTRATRRREHQRTRHRRRIFALHA